MQEKKKENTLSTKKTLTKNKEVMYLYKKRKFFLLFLVAYLVKSVFSSFFLDRYRFFFLFFYHAFLVESVISYFLTFLFSFINSHLRTIGAQEAISDI